MPLSGEVPARQRGNDLMAQAEAGPCKIPAQESTLISNVDRLTVSSKSTSPVCDRINQEIGTVSIETNEHPSEDPEPERTQQRVPQRQQHERRRIRVKRPRQQVSSVCGSLPPAGELCNV